MLTLYDYYRSTASYRVRIALNYKKLEYTLKQVHLINNHGEQHHDDYKKLNPQSLVPTLVDNDNILTQSLAIIEYLESVYPNPALLPADPILCQQVRAIALNIACDIHPLNNLRVLQYLKNELHVSDDTKITWYHHWLQTGFTALETSLAKQDGPFCFGKNVTLADLCLIPQIYNANRFKFDMTPYPRLSAINDHCLQLDYFADAAPA